MLNEIVEGTVEEKFERNTNIKVQNQVIHENQYIWKFSKLIHCPTFACWFHPAGSVWGREKGTLLVGRDRAELSLELPVAAPPPRQDEARHLLNSQSTSTPNLPPEISYPRLIPPPIRQTTYTIRFDNVQMHLWHHTILIRHTDWGLYTCTSFDTYVWTRIDIGYSIIYVFVANA